jgi:hypothetical protein
MVASTRSRTARRCPPVGRRGRSDRETIRGGAHQQAPGLIVSWSDCLIVFPFRRPAHFLPMPRPDGRLADQPRPLSFTPGFAPHAAVGPLGVRRSGADQAAFLDNGGKIVVGRQFVANPEATSRNTTPATFRPALGGRAPRTAWTAAAGASATRILEGHILTAAACRRPKA